MRWREHSETENFGVGVLEEVCGWGRDGAEDEGICYHSARGREARTMRLERKEWLIHILLYYIIIVFWLGWIGKLRLVGGDRGAGLERNNCVRNEFTVISFASIWNLQSVILYH